ncbi:hypothetical protein CKM354_000639200 [Cercospora kikuchii]|uniref:Uncharacterized protein n=1 Tax=Cercospora kikuchii TaxID=84275 RepID=A0A9P3FHR8_9PEZI|nr:uncharacterized protein CKM354_000639200 [Cercospora kikuchii]GIZ43154.1 hypothetical protein CKM354_000639200 [Cercospora kikuchii]
MSPMKPYTYAGPIDHTTPIAWSELLGKSIIITGGANGMGETTVRKFVEAGAFVTFGDVNEARGKEVEAELNQKFGEKCQFVKCDIRNWEDQLKLFEKATSDGRGLDVVIANAGISRASGDSLWNLDDLSKPPVKPDLNIIQTNVNGTLYTFKLATYHFRKQKTPGGCFIMTGSLVAYIDSPANWEYTASKYALRGLLHTVRRNSWEQGIRIAYVAPCYIKSAIRTAEWEASLLKQNVPFGETEDVAACFARIATDPETNGHSLMIVPRSLAPQGFMDTGLEDFTEEGFMKATQVSQLNVIKDRWLEGAEIQPYKK